MTAPAVPERTTPGLPLSEAWERCRELDRRMNTGAATGPSAIDREENP